MAIAFDISIKDTLVEGAITPVVHAEVNGDDCRFVDEDIAIQAQINRPASTARDAIAPPPGMEKGEVFFRKPAGTVRLDEGGIESLIGNAVAVEDDAIAVL